MVMIPELVNLEEDLMERPIQEERFEDLAQALRDEGHEELEVRRIVRAGVVLGFELYCTCSIGVLPWCYNQFQLLKQKFITR